MTELNIFLAFGALLLAAAGMRLGWSIACQVYRDDGWD